MTSATTSVLQAVRELTPTIAARCADIDAARRLPPDLLERLKAAGCFRMFVPRSHGGEDLDLLPGLEIIETLARADGAAAWTVMIGSETAHLLALLPRHVYDEVYAKGPDVIMGGAFNAQGRAEKVEGGYRVNGHWNFASGSQHCDLFFGNCVVTQNGRPLPGPAEGIPATRAMLFKQSDVRILENWSVLGLRGTDSHDIAVEDVFVPEERSFDIFQGLSSIPGPSFVAPVLHFALHMGAVGVGIAQGAVDDAISLARSGQKRLYARAPLADSPVFHLHLGRAETHVRAAWAALRDVSELFWDACKRGPEHVREVSPRVSATLAWVGETTSAAVDECYKAGGGNATRDSSPLQRRFRDIHTFAQHAGVAEGWFGQLGAVLLGHPVTFSF
ncbi:acyl-CoA dehydrogenase family protein [Myxococcaceae bacterium GXIMD 01537]